jgi:hypothetical protein
MGLKDSLQDLITNTEYGKHCKFGTIYLGMDEDTQQLLTAALKSSAKTMDITKALNADGIQVRREHVGEKRACFTENNENCCLRNKNKESK